MTVGQVQIRRALALGEVCAEKILECAGILAKGVTQYVRVRVKLCVRVASQHDVPFLLGEALEESPSVVYPGGLLCPLLLFGKAVFVAVKGWSNLIRPPLSVFYTIFQISVSFRILLLNDVHCLKFRF